MTPQRRTALVSVVAALVLIGLKLGAGLASGSLGLVSESIHSGTDLVAALLTFFALGVAGRPADPGHPYGHGKAEHLAALAEATILVLASLFISYRAIEHLVGSVERDVDAAWYTFLVIGVVI
ncbi:MAG: cation diffusion facilitator family transporter, partial [Gaiellaceae bacterium]